MALFALFRLNAGDESESSILDPSKQEVIGSWSCWYSVGLVVEFAIRIFKKSP